MKTVSRLFTATFALVGALAAGNVHATCTPPPAGIVGWWKGDGTAVDVVSSNNGVLVNVGYTNGVDGQAFAFDPENYPYGTYTGVQIADSPAYALTNSLTIEGWIRPRGDGYLVFFRGDNRPGLDPYQLSMQANNLCDFYVTDANGNNDSVGVTLAYGNWVHLAATLDGSAGTISIYTNGILAAQKATAIRPFGNLIAGDSPGIGIGNVNDGFNNFPFLGDIDEIALYNRALTPAEIAAIYNAGSAGKCAPNSSAASLLVNGGFENPPGIYPYQVFDSGNPMPGWIVESGTVEITAGTYWQSAEGAQSLDLNGIFDQIGTIYQDVPTVPGQNYKIRFAYAGNPECTSPTLKTANAYWSGVLLTNLSFDVTGHAVTNMGWIYYQQIVTATSTNSRIRFQATSLSFCGLTLDDVSVTPTSQPVSPSCTPAPAGIVGWWPAENNANDLAGTNNGTLQAGLGFASGEKGLSFNFINTNQSVFVPASAGLDVGAAPGFTLETWINPSDITQAHPLFEWNDGTYFGPHFYIEVSQTFNTNTGPGELYANIPDPADGWHQLSSPGGIVNTNVFQHVALTYDKTSGLAMIYYNGQVVAQQNFGSFTPRTFGRDLYLGRRPAPEMVGFLGKMDEPAVYNRALSSNEIAAIYDAGSAGKCTTGTGTPTCTPPPAGLVSWWPGNGSANDSTGGNAGTWSGFGSLNTYVSGTVQQAFSFDGTHRDRVDVGNPSNLQLQNFSIEAWVKRSSATSASGDENFADGSIAGPGAFIFGYGAGGYGLVLFDDGSLGLTQNSVNDTHVPPVITDTSWHHVAVTKSGGTVLFYVDGAQQPTPSLNPYTNVFQFTSSAAIGSRGDGGGNTFYGLVDELAVYNHALASNEIAAIYSAGSAGKCSAAQSLAGVPAIFNFSPASGTNGTVLAIVGTNFSANAAANVVYFGAVRANVLTASSNSLIVTVPAGATFAPITVTVNGLTAWASAPFMPTFNGGTNALALAPRLDLPAGDGPGQAIFADVDGDGKPDLLVSSGSPHFMSIYRNISTGGIVTSNSFAPRVDVPMPGNIQNAVLADIDGDGKLDIAVLDRDAAQVHILKNLSTPGNINTNSFAASVNLSTGNDPRGIVVRDLDGDGLPDIAVANWADNTVSVYQNLGTASGITSNSFAARVNFTVGTQPQDLKAADVDGDGKPDLVTANNYYGTDESVSVLRNTSSLGTISFAPRVALSALQSSYCLAIGDMDGDGRQDIVVSSFDGGQAISIFRNQSAPSDISFATHVDFAVGGWGNGVAIGDLDGDGKPDLAVVTQLPDHLSIFKNISTPGSVALAPRMDYPTGWNPNGIAIGDLDGDGQPDIEFAVSYGATLSIYQNQTPSGPPLAPTITSQPTNLTVTVNGTAVFNVTATGMSPLIYQWIFNGTNLPGATNATLTLNNVHSVNAGNYSLTVSNIAGGVISSNATLTVYVPPVPPTILSQTPSQVVLVGSAATFSVTASSDFLSYFWSRNSVLIPGATNSSYTLFNAQLSDSGSKFSCLVTNLYGSVSSTNATLKVIDTVSNDLCSGAVVITNASYTNVQSTLKASAFGDPSPDCVDGFGHGVWYQFTAPVAGLLIVDTFGSDFDTGLAIYTGSCDSMTEVACNDDAGGVTSQVTLPTTAGATYFILAGGYASDSGNLVLHLNHLTPPAFDVQPTNISVIVSSNGSFSAALSGTLPMSLQWFFNNSPLADGGRISGSTNSSLNITGVQTNDGGNYLLVASNVIGVTTSSVAVLTPIILPPVFLVQPASQSVLIGSNVNFFAVVDGTPPYSYQWSFNGSPLADDGVHIAGSATSSLTISNLTTADAGNYSLLVTNVSGATNSAIAALTVLVPPAITVNPVGRSVPPGLPTTFNASASGIPSPSYQWQLNGTNIPGANGSTYTVSAVGTNNLGFYHLVASNTVGVAVSADAALTFGPVAAWGRNLNNESLPPPGLAGVTAIAGNSGAGFAVLTNGSVIAWGGGTGINSTNIPASATNVVALSAFGASGTLALRADGRVVGWNGVTVPVLSNIVAVAAGNNFGYGLRAEGTVTNWGGVPIPNSLAGINHVIAIAAGANNAAALRSDSSLVVSGIGAVTNVPSGMSNLVAIAVGNSYAMALRADGKVFAWGSGTGTNLPANLTNIVAISAGNYPGENFGVAIRANGTVAAWGDNAGYGETTPPGALSNLVSVAIAASPFHGLALVNDGSPQILRPPVGLTAYTGRDVTLSAKAVGAAPLSYQWLLNGTNLPNATNTSLVISNIQFVNAGAYQLFVSNSIGTAISLPAPVNVIVGPLTILTQTTSSPTNSYQGGKFTVGGVTVQGSGPVSYQWFFSRTNNNYAAISGATNDTLTMDPALALHTGNYYLAASNQISGITSAPVFVRVLFAKAWGYLATDPPTNLVVTNATAIAVGNLGLGTASGHYLVLKSDGKISSWAGGFVSYGETNVAALSNSIVTAIAAGYGDSLALKSDGTVYAWGNNSYGETNVPAGLSGVTAIACGDYHDLALKSDGTVVGWGQNTYQQTTNVSATNVVAIAAGGQNSIALRADGSVTTWGSYGAQPPGQFSIPTSVTNVVAVAAGGTHFLALRANGTVVGWGSNPYGQTTIPASWSNIVAICASGNHSTALRNDGTVLTLGNSYIGFFSNNVPSDLANVIAIACSGDHDLGLFGTRAPAFTVQPWNRSVIFNTTTNIRLTGKCSGVQPVRYQWQLNGVNVSNATNDTLVLSNRFDSGFPVVVIPQGTYQLVVSNAYGVTVSKPAKVTLTYPLGYALNATNLTWTTSGSAQWFGETNITHDGVAAARSGGIGPLQETILQTTFTTNNSGTATFWWKVSSEQYFDTLEFRVNGIVQGVISGEVDWQQASVPISAGTNLLQWRYSKDSSFDSGLDAGFVDQFVFASAPQITRQPAGVTANLGATVNLSVLASGAPPMGYRWQQNGSPVGGNSSVLTLSNVARAQDGTYSVTVTNGGGAVVSSNAIVHVNVPQLLGAPVLLPDGSLQLTSTDANGGTLSPSDLPNFEAQASADLVNWVTLPNALSLTNGMLQLQDTARTNYSARYYRIIEH